MPKSTEQKIQELELQTVKAVTELQKDVQNLTNEVSKLTEQISKMTENYVTKIDHLEDITTLRADLVTAKRVGMVRTILVGILTAGLTALITIEISRAIK
jgi:uncharacterized protein YlxW (UPF0749 family)